MSYAELVEEAAAVIRVEGIAATTCHPVGECRWCDAARVVSAERSPGRRLLMPAKSEAQRRFLFAKFGSAWVHAHGFANKGKLPARVGRGSRRRKRKRR